MIYNLTRNIWTLAIVATVFFASCDDDSVDPTIPVGTEGYFIVNEGGWGNGNTSLSYYDRESGVVANDIFYYANDELALGDQSQSMTIHNELGYIVVQNSAKIEVINIDDFTSVTTIDAGIVSPRYFAGYSDTKAYVSDWGDGFTGSIKVIDLSDNTVSKTIETGSGTNEIILANDKIYTVNAGGFDRDNTLVIIDAIQDEITKKVEVGDNPSSIKMDVNGNIWVLTQGYTAYDSNWNIDFENSTNGSLVELNASGDILQTLIFPEFGSPSRLSMNVAGDKLYYLYNGGVYQMNINSDELPTNPIIQKYYYGLSIDPLTSNVIGCEAPSFDTSGNIDIYSSTGALIESQSVGIAPNSITYK